MKMPHPATHRGQRGQSMTEYVVATGAIALAVSLSMLDPDSPLKALFDGFKEAYEKFSHALSLPF